MRPLKQPPFASVRLNASDAAGDALIVPACGATAVRAIDAVAAAVAATDAGLQYLSVQTVRASAAA